MKDKVEVDQKDLYSFLGTLSKRLQLRGESLMGLVHLGMGTVNEESIDELGDLLRQDATRLKATRDLLCDRCRFHEVIDVFEIRKSKGGPKK